MKKATKGAQAPKKGPIAKAKIAQQSQTPLPARSLAVTPQKQVSAPKRKTFKEVHSLGSEMRHDDIGVRYEAPTKGPRGVGLAPCALNYAKAVSNPFGEFADLPCVPGDPPLPTYRFRATTRGTFSTSTSNSNGFVAVAPKCGFNDIATVFSTTSSFGGTAIATSGTGVTASFRSTLPFTNGFITANGMSMRLVGMGLRVRNITQALYMGGILFGLQIDQNELSTTFTASSIPADPRTALVAQAMADQKSWSVMVWRPTDMGDLDFMGEDTGYGAADPKLFFWCIAPPGAPQTFEFELIEFWEFYGRGVPEYTVSHADPVGLSRVLDGIQMRPITLDQKDWVNHTAQAVVDSIAHSDSVAKTVEDLLGLAGMGGGLVGGLVKGLTSFLLL